MARQQPELEYYPEYPIKSLARSSRTLRLVHNPCPNCLLGVRRGIIFNQLNQKDKISY